MLFQFRQLPPPRITKIPSPPSTLWARSESATVGIEGIASGPPGIKFDRNETHCRFSRAATACFATSGGPGERKARVGRSATEHPECKMVRILPLDGADHGVAVLILNQSKDAIFITG